MAEPMVACGYSHTIFQKTDGTVWGCGRNTDGQLGLGDTTDRLTPVRLSITNVKQVSCLDHTIFIKNDGTVWGCGNNYNGQLGLGDNARVPIPTLVGITNVKQVVCGNHTIFLKNDSTVWGCGRNDNSQLGLGNSSTTLTPVRLNITGVKQVACGYHHTIFLKNDGTVWGCGLNNLGQLGLGDNTNRNTPTQIDITDVKQVVSGGNHNIFLKNDGTLWGCGRNDLGQLGLGDTTQRNTPVQIDITDVKQVACGDIHTIFIKNDGSAWGCGWNSNGQLGLGNIYNRTKPVQLNITGVKQVACGGVHTIFIKTDGTAWSCGNNRYGELGLGDNTDRKTPVQIGIVLVTLMILLQDAGNYKTITEGALQTLENQELNTANFEQNGFTEANDIRDVWTELGQECSVLVYDNSAANDSIAVTHLPAAQLVKQTEDIDLSRYNIIRQITMNTTGNNGVAKAALSFDCGSTWKTYADGWQDIELTTDAILANGLTAAAVSAITMEQWMAAITGTLRIAYVLSKNAVTDNIAVDRLTVTGDTASWKKAKRTVDYNGKLPNTNTMIIQLLKDGSYKINYMEAKQK